MSSTPVLLLTGFLGSGKTTLLNHLLRQPELANQRLALIINEFGSLNIDGQLVEQRQYPIHEINQGSLFCACTQTQLMQVFRQIATQDRAELVLVEATGIAEVRDLEGLLSAQFGSSFSIQANVCVIDARHFVRVAAMLATLRHQVVYADGLVVNKSDLVHESELVQLEQVLASMNQHAPCIRVVNGQAPMSFLLNLQHASLPAGSATSPPEHLVAVTIPTPGIINHDQLQQAINKLGEHLLRLKGIVDFGDGHRLVEVAGQIYSERALDDRDDLPTGCALSVIGWQISKQHLIAAFFEHLSQPVNEINHRS